MGDKLAERDRKALGSKAIEEIDAGIPIPETSNASTSSIAGFVDKPYCRGFVKNRSIFRTFIMSEAKARQKGDHRKPDVMKAEFKIAVSC